ncbi:hypothetical protein [Veronia pacifica]|uniref:TM2 domain-containing protein n=1 Tax=Veronia pacifica TaxID=1080227 RepID=A0A1C3EMW5_9GAMM|nr:hypothetical protein [Veronia pacifica]ODA34549.1 hypothetical protein A8L45_06155 [Veronia pacifica]
MSIFEPIEALEHREERLSAEVKTLSDAERKLYFKAQTKQLKDPDTYASLNWSFIGGIHHIYLGKYLVFTVEFILLLVAVAGIVAGFELFIIILVALALFELPQLFFSQKIVRQKNYQISRSILDEIKRSPNKDV